MSKSAVADPIIECGVLAGDDIAVNDCLRTQLDINYRAMTEAQELARGAGGGVQGSPHMGFAPTMRSA